MPEQNRILCRELSLLAFNRRVLAHAQKTQTLQQRNFRILRLSQYTAVKRQQAEFSAGYESSFVGAFAFFVHRVFQFGRIF